MAVGVVSLDAISVCKESLWVCICVIPANVGIIYETTSENY